MRICINPTYNASDLTEGGIRRVVDAMVKFLPEFGLDVTPNPEGADLIVNHGTYNLQRPGVPTVAACHGLYWSEYNWDVWASDANRAVTENMREAAAITVPSQWVAQAVSRGLWRPVHTVYHGVDSELWTPRTTQGYVLWNKARTDPVSNHEDLDRISEFMPETPFVSTFGTPRVNSRIIGTQSYEQMKTLVQHAGVYLQTARETGGIGAMEALSAGVPVVGWNYGAQSEIVIQGETGYLAPYGDYEQLADCIHKCFDQRRRLSANARADVQERWGWEDKIEQYANIYKNVLDQRRKPHPRVSVVITCYNLGKYVNAAIESVAHQSMENDQYECIVVDDRSTDNSYEICQQMVEYIKSRGNFNITVVQPPKNLGLSGARNFGASIAKGRNLLFLDADDQLTSNALIEMCDALDRRSETDIVYGPLDTINEAGEQRARNPWPSGEFNFTDQMAHLNQLPYASMMRRRVWENLGGYRTRDWRAEDASFWCRAASFGYHITSLNIEAPLLYRIRSNSKSGVERENYPDPVDGDWTSWFPWRMGASSGALGSALLDQSPKPELNVALVPFGAQGAAPKRRHAWDVRHHQAPAVSIIIPVGPNHSSWLIDALDSVMAQTCPEWEVLVVYDNSLPFPEDLFPWARFMYSTNGIVPPYDPLGAGEARNVGIRNARAPLVLFLDADDVLRPNAVERMLQEYSVDGGYVYCDTLAVLENARIADVATGDWSNLPILLRGSKVEGPAIIPAPEWDQKEFLESGYNGRPGCHSVTALVATADALGVGGFDPNMKALEDWEFYMRLAASGITGHLVKEPLLVYRLHTGTRREDRAGQQTDLENIIRDRYAPFISGEYPMCSCGSGGGGPQAQVRAAAALASMVPADYNTFIPEVGEIQEYVEKGQDIRLKYIGDMYGAVTYRGIISHRTYRAGQDPAFEAIDADPRDVQNLIMTGAFQVVKVQ